MSTIDNYTNQCQSLFWQGLPMFHRFYKVAPSGIELESKASEASILSIKLQSRGKSERMKEGRNERMNTSDHLFYFSISFAKVIIK